MKNSLEKIVSICEEAAVEDGVLKEICLTAKSQLIKIEWKDKYGIDVPSYFEPAKSDYVDVSSYVTLSYFKDGYYSNENSCGRSISWSEDGKQPVNEWIYSIQFPTGAYIFGDDYEGQKCLFQEFFEELKGFNPDYVDNHNKCLYWKIENASEINNNFIAVLRKYSEVNKNELKQRKIDKLQKELDRLKSNNQ